MNRILGLLISLLVTFVDCQFYRDHLAYDQVFDVEQHYSALQATQLWPSMGYSLTRGNIKFWPLRRWKFITLTLFSETTTNTVTVSTTCTYSTAALALCTARTTPSSSTSSTTPTTTTTTPTTTTTTPTTTTTTPTTTTTTPTTTTTTPTTTTTTPTTTTTTPTTTTTTPTTSTTTPTTPTTTPTTTTRPATPSVIPSTQTPPTVTPANPATTRTPPTGRPRLLPFNETDIGSKPFSHLRIEPVRSTSSGIIPYILQPGIVAFDNSRRRRIFISFATSTLTRITTSTYTVRLSATCQSISDFQTCSPMSF